MRGAARQDQSTTQNTQTIRESSSTMQHTAVLAGNLSHLDCIVQADDLLPGAPRQEGGNAREVLRAGRQGGQGSKAGRTMTAVRGTVRKPQAGVHRWTEQCAWLPMGLDAQAQPTCATYTGLQPATPRRTSSTPLPQPTHLVVLQVLVSKHLSLLLSPRPHKPAELVVGIRVAAGNTTGGRLRV